MENKIIRSVVNIINVVKLENIVRLEAGCIQHSQPKMKLKIKTPNVRIEINSIVKIK